MRHQSFDLRRVTAILLEQKNFGPNVIDYVFWESGGQSLSDQYFKPYIVPNVSDQYFKPYIV